MGHFYISSLSSSMAGMHLLLIFAAGLLSCQAGRLPYIVGGKDAALGAWPWQASLQRHGSHSCGASLVSDRWLVTASHCVEETLSTYTIILGMHDREAQSQGAPKRYGVAKIIKHPGWRPRLPGFPNDIALVELSEPAVMGEFVKTIEMADSDEGFAGEPDCYVTGWGRTKGGGPLPDILQEAHIDVYTQEYCRKTMFGSILRDGHICIGKRFKSGSCQGDSGGPLVCKVAGKWKLVGATSFGVAGCRPMFPSVYSRVSYYRTWIRKTINV